MLMKEFRELAQCAFHAPCSDLPDTAVGFPQCSAERLILFAAEIVTAELEGGVPAQEVVGGGSLCRIRREVIEGFCTDSACFSVLQLFRDVLCQVKLREVDERIGISREHAGTGRSVH